MDLGNTKYSAAGEPSQPKPQAMEASPYPAEKRIVNSKNTNRQSFPVSLE
jgi:hypothetical protein